MLTRTETHSNQTPYTPFRQVDVMLEMRYPTCTGGMQNKIAEIACRLVAPDQIMLHEGNIITFASDGVFTNNCCEYVSLAHAMILLKATKGSTADWYKNHTDPTFFVKDLRKYNESRVPEQCLNCITTGKELLKEISTRPAVFEQLNGKRGGKMIIHDVPKGFQPGSIKWAILEDERVYVSLRSVVTFALSKVDGLPNDSKVGRNLNNIKNEMKESDIKKFKFGSDNTGKKNTKN
jgi:hypothetical protein